jgi:hypothetical protein
MSTEIRVKDASGAELTFIERELENSHQELEQTSLKTQNVTQFSGFYNTKPKEITLTLQESVVERLTQDLQKWTTKFNIDRFRLNVTFYTESPDKTREYAVLSSDAAGKLNWVMKEIPKIKKNDLEISFKIREGQLATKQSHFQELQRATEKLSDPKLLSAKIGIYGSAWDQQNVPIPPINLCYVIKK